MWGISGVTNPAASVPGAGERRGRDAWIASVYRGVRAVKCAAAGFRGINGRRPARTRVPSIYSTTLASHWTAVRAAIPGLRAIPPKTFPRIPS